MYRCDKRTLADADFCACLGCATRRLAAFGLAEFSGTSGMLDKQHENRCAAASVGGVGVARKSMHLRGAEQFIFVE